MNKKEAEVGGKPSIALGTVFFLLILLLAVFILFLFFLRYSNFSPLSNYLPKKVESKTSLSSDYLAKANTAGTLSTITIKVTEDEISQSVGVAGENFPVKKAKLSISPLGLTVKGRSSNFIWGFPIETLLIPKAEQGKLVFEIVSIKAAGVVAPPKLTDTLSPKFKTAFSNLLPAEEKFAVTDVKPSDGFLLLEVMRR